MILICIALMAKAVKHLSFHILIGHLYISFREMSIKSLCPFKSWVICLFMIEL